MQNSWPRRRTDHSDGTDGRDAPEIGIEIERLLEVLAHQVGLRLWILFLPGGETAAVQVVDGTTTPVPDDVVDWARTIAMTGIAGGGAGPVSVPDLGADDRLSHLASLDHLVVGSMIAAEVPTGGDLPGVLAGIDPEARDATLGAGLPLVEVMAQTLGTLSRLRRTSDQAQLEAIEAREQGQRDGLTGLFNRDGWDAAIRREAERCRTLGRGASVVIIDLDDLKDLNDRYGHSFGDERLTTLAGVIADTARADDVVARLGGDEFGLLAPGSAPGTGESLAARLSDGFRAKDLSASVGAAECPPGGDLLETWRRADLEMYAVKRVRRTPSGRTLRSAPSSNGEQRSSGPTGALVEELCLSLGAAATVATTPWRVARRVLGR